MKYVLVIGDGMADGPVAALGGKTPLEYLDLYAMDMMAGCETGTARTVPLGVAPGSDTAILNIFGYDPRAYYTGRSVLEAAGVGVLLKEGEVSFRMNLCAVEGGVMRSHNGGGIEGDEAETLMRDLLRDPAFAELAERVSLRVQVSRTFRHIGVIRAESDAVFTLTEPHNILTQSIAPYFPKGALSGELTALMRQSYIFLDEHPVNASRRRRGLLPANMLWPWGAGRAIALPSFVDKFHHGGQVVSAVPLVWGIAGLAGLDAPKVDGATGDLDTNYRGKVDAVLHALKNAADFAALHVEAPDEMSHAGDLSKKLEAIRRLNDRVIEPLLSELPDVDGDFRMLLLSDHYTLLSTRTHDATPVPWALYDSRAHASPTKFCEKTAAKGRALENGDLLLPMLFETENV